MICIKIEEQPRRQGNQGAGQEATNQTGQAADSRKTSNVTIRFQEKYDSSGVGDNRRVTLKEICPGRGSDTALHALRLRDPCSLGPRLQGRRLLVIQ